ncbi:MAG TPA: RHS repeat-associated core domain-containing protein, partial [Gemmataceae bacterium]|nr:RHS repeat-associated core domain-containing protein [Gemmataceae bacterium]
NGLKEAATDTFGNAVTYSYDAQGNMTQSTDQAGNVTIVTYDPILNDVTSITTPSGAVTHYAYDVHGNLTQLTDALGDITTMSYDIRGLLLSQTSPRGNLSPTPAAYTTTFTYNDAGQVLTHSTGLPSTESFSYNTRGDLIQATDADGNTTHYAYDLLDRLLQTTDADGNQTSYRYDAVGNRIAITDSLGRTTRSTYDLLRHLLTITFADGTIQTQAYDADGDATTATDALGRAVTTVFDTQNRPIITMTADGASAETHYDGAGRIVATVDQLGNVTRYAFDALGRLRETLDPLGGVTVRSYDAGNNVTFVTDMLGRTTQYQVDLLNRQTAVIDPLHNTTSTNYDADGNVTSVTDPLGHMTQYGYDVRDRLTTVTDALSGITTKTYDAVGNLRSITDPAGTTTTFEYDNLNRLESDTIEGLGASATETFTYDAAGRLIATTDRDGRTRQFTYDARDRRTAEIWLNGSGTPVETMQFSFDAAGELAAAGDADSAYFYTYDVLGRTASVDNSGTSGVPDVVLSYSYDAAGNLLSVVDQINNALTGTESFTHDALGYVTRITDSGNGLASARVDLSHDASGAFTQVDRYADLAGTQFVVGSTYAYDAAGRLTDLVHATNSITIAAYQWTFDAANRITQETSPDGTTTYGYDALNQVTSVTSSLPAENYSYNASGNRTNAGYATGADNRLASDGVYNYTYDPDGNLTQRTEIATGDVTLYTWDYRNRLTEVISKDSLGNVTQQVVYTYDVFDRRIAKAITIGGVTGVERFVYSGDNAVLQFNGAGSLTDHYLFGPALNQVLADERSASQVFWPLTDSRGSVRDIADSSGAVVDHISYNSFGQIVAETNPTIGFLYGYAGNAYDPETGMQYDRARYYDPGIGRFISQDPIAFSGGDTNLYRYVGNNPVNAIDPTGLTTWGGFTTTLGVTEPAGETSTLEDFLSSQFDLGTMQGDFIEADIISAFFKKGVRTVFHPIQYVEESLSSIISLITDPKGTWDALVHAWQRDPGKLIGETLFDVVLHEGISAAGATVFGPSAEISAARNTANAGSVGVAPTGQTVASTITAASETPAAAGAGLRPPDVYYDFPVFYRGETAPAIPTWVFVKNPYKAVFEGSRTFYWLDAADVYIRRTPLLDAELKWVLTGQGRS